MAGTGLDCSHPIELDEDKGGPHRKRASKNAQSAPQNLTTYLLYWFSHCWDKGNLRGNEGVLAQFQWVQPPWWRRYGGSTMRHLVTSQAEAGRDECLALGFFFSPLFSSGLQPRAC